MPSANTLPFKQQLKTALSVALLISVIEVINLFTNRSLNQFGLIPRDIGGLTGLITAPFLHGSLWHYLSNIIPFTLFSILMMQHGTSRYIKVSFACTVVSGLLVWVFARQAIHVGASGLIYGYFGYLVLAGFLSGRVKLILISLFVGISYGTLVFGVLPIGRYISWESHLFGLLTGLACAYFFNKRK